MKKVKTTRLILKAGLIIFIITGASAEQQYSRSGCLYSTFVGGSTQVGPCSDKDILNVADDLNIKKIMREFSIPNTQVRFVACDNAEFLAQPDLDFEGAERKYIVKYHKKASNTYLAPITHELAHIMQMEMNGGIDNLWNVYKESKKIELEADYLAGIAFQNTLVNLDINLFQHSLLLMGKFVENFEHAHGTPSQRMAAFRFGNHMEFNSVGGDFKKASRSFRDKEFGHVLQM
jgi:hypothetical protein